MPFLELKEELAKRISRHLSHPQLSAPIILNELCAPPDPEMGHISLPCFKLAKLLKKAADAIASELVSHLGAKTLSAQAKGPYANFHWDTAMLFGLTIPKVFSEKELYGSSKNSRGKLVIEYCSPNIAKKLGFHHIRTTLIGNALANIYQSQGFITYRLNFVGDWGSQFARLLAAFAQWGNPAILSDGKNAMAELMSVYTRFHKELESDPSQLDKASQWLKRLEEGDEAALQLWKDIRRVSIEQMQQTLSRMNISFDYTEGESGYLKSMASVLRMIKEKTGARLSEGAWIVELEGIATPALIQKRDGTTLYLTRDIAAAIDRYERFQFDRMIYVVSDQQRLHFQQLFATLVKMGYPWTNTLGHVGFGTVLFGSEKMSTREGRVILLDELLAEAHARALAVCTEKNPNLSNKEAVAEAVGIGAIIFGQLSSHRTRDIEFDWSSVLALDGETGPYVQYSAVRCRSLLEKAKSKGLTASSDYPGSFATEEDALILQISRFQSELVRCIRDNDPCYLTSYLIDLAKSFNRFYLRLPVLQCNDEPTRAMRLALVEGTFQTLQNGLSLLSMTCPPEM